MLLYVIFGYNNEVLIFKTHIQKSEINSGYLEDYNLWKKVSDTLFSSKKPNDIGNICWSGLQTTNVDHGNSEYIVIQN